MATPEEEVIVDGEAAPNPEAHVDPELPRGDPVVEPTSEKLQDDEEPKKETSDEKETTDQNLKTTLLISGAVVAVIGALFAILKKIK